MINLFLHPVYLKIGVMIALLIMSLGSSALPFLVSKYVKNTVTIFSVMNCLSGGVVLGAALSHMMPSGEENFAQYFGTDSKSPLANYPLVPAIAAMGLILLLTIDRTLLAGSHSHSEVKVESGSQKYTKNHSHHSHSHEHSKKPKKSYGTLTASEYPTAVPPSPINSIQYPTLPSPYVTPGEPTYTVGSPSPADRLLLEDSTTVDVGFNTDKLNQSMRDFNEDHDNKGAVTKAWIFLCALSVHSVLEGLGMGAEDNENAFLSVMFAVLAHKCLEAFALGLSVFYAKFSLSVTCAMIVGYSFATPIGVAAGIAASQLSGNQSLIAGILVSVAAGSFLYISLIEILPTELHKPNKMGIKIAAMIFGWFGMALLAYWA